MFGTFGTTEIILIVLGLLLLFGGKKIPELMKGLGSGIKEFKKASDGTSDDDDQARRDKERLESRDRADSQKVVDDRRIEERR